MGGGIGGGAIEIALDGTADGEIPAMHDETRDRTPSMRAWSLT